MNKNCDRTTNNKYFDAPARMNDGRTFTDYRASSSVDDMIRYSNNVMSNYEYRQFLINNADEIMDVNRKYTEDKVGTRTCNAKEIPFHTTCDINPSFSKCSITNSEGVGLKNVVKPIENFGSFINYK
jgi:hypothetical protein